MHYRWSASVISTGLGNKEVVWRNGRLLAPTNVHIPPRKAAMQSDDSLHEHSLAAKQNSSEAAVASKANQLAFRISDNANPMIMTPTRKMKAAMPSIAKHCPL